MAPTSLLVTSSAVLAREDDFLVDDDDDENWSDLEGLAQRASSFVGLSRAPSLSLSQIERPEDEGDGEGDLAAKLAWLRRGEGLDDAEATNDACAELLAASEAGDSCSTPTGVAAALASIETVRSFVAVRGMASFVEGSVNVFFHVPTKRKARTDGFDWIEGSVALILLAPDPAMSPAKAEALSAGTRKGLHFGGREYHLAVPEGSRRRLGDRLTLAASSVSFSSPSSPAGLGESPLGASVVLQHGSDKDSRLKAHKYQLVRPKAPTSKAPWRSDDAAGTLAAMAGRVEAPTSGGGSGGAPASAAAAAAAFVSHCVSSSAAAETDNDGRTSSKRPRSDDDDVFTNFGSGDSDSGLGLGLGSFGGEDAEVEAEVLGQAWALVAALPSRASRRRLVAGLAAGLVAGLDAEVCRDQIPSPLSSCHFEL